MIETVRQITCDWCGEFEQTGIKGIGEKNLVKRAEKRGWLKVVNGNGKINHFCCKKCYNLHKEEESKH